MKTFHIKEHMMNLLFSDDGCADGFGVTLADGCFSCFFSGLGVYDAGFGVTLVDKCFSCFFSELGVYDVGFDCGKALFN